MKEEKSIIFIQYYEYISTDSYTLTFEHIKCFGFVIFFPLKFFFLSIVHSSLNSFIGTSILRCLISNKSQNSRIFREFNSLKLSIGKEAKDSGEDIKNKANTADRILIQVINLTRSFLPLNPTTIRRKSYGVRMTIKYKTEKKIQWKTYIIIAW